MGHIDTTTKVNKITDDGFSKRVEFKLLKGSVKLDNFKTGNVRIGFGEMGNIPSKTAYSLIENDGEIFFKGNCNISICSTISNHGQLFFGENINITADCHIICFKSVSIGDNCLISWKTQIMDTDQHKIYDSDKNLLNPDSPVIIGNHCWIYNNVTIMKGVNIPDNVVIASNSLITKSVLKPNVIVGNKGEIIKENIVWER